MPITRVPTPVNVDANKNSSVHSQAASGICFASPDNVPICIIPGIHGKSLELIPLANALLKHNFQRPIYLYQDELHHSLTPRPKLSLVEHAQSIADQLYEIMRLSTLPLTLIGYSYGGMLAVEVAKLLEIKRGIASPVFVIDGISKELTREYYFTAEVTHDMVSIVDIAAIMCGNKPTGITANGIKALSTSVDPVRRIDDLHRRVLENNKTNVTNESQTLDSDNQANVALAAYLNTFQVIKQNVGCIRQPEPQTIPIKLQNLHVFLTAETKKKLKTENGGWGKHAQNLYLLDHRYLVNQPHLALLQEDKNATHLARMMTDLIKRLLPIDYLTNLQVETLKRMSQQARYQEMASSESSETSEDYYSCSPPSRSRELPEFIPETATKGNALPALPPSEPISFSRSSSSLFGASNQTPPPSAIPTISRADSSSSLEFHNKG